MRRLELFSRPVYWVSLVLLITNDFIFKEMYPGFITGKVSDFAGLIVLPLFIFGLFPNFFPTSRRIILLLIGSGTVLSILQIQAFLDFFDQILLFFYLPNHNLTADTTDLVALTVLPFIYVYLQKKTQSEKSPIINSNRVRVSHMILGCLSFFALCATSFTGTNKLSVKKPVSSNLDVDKTLFNIQKRLGEEGITTRLTGVNGDSIYIVKVEFEDSVWTVYKEALHKREAFFEGELAFKVDQINNSLIINEFRLLTWNRGIEDSTATRIFEKRFEPLLF